MPDSQEISRKTARTKKQPPINAQMPCLLAFLLPSPVYVTRRRRQGSTITAAQEDVVTQPKRLEVIPRLHA